MRSTRSRIRLESLESRALLTTSVGFNDNFTQDVSDKVGTVNVNVGFLANDPGDTTPVTVTVSTGGGTAVPGVDYTPVQKTITLTPNTVTAPSPTATAQLAIPILRGPASLGTRTLRVSVSPTPGAPQGQSEFLVIHHGTDTTDPTIVSSQALTQAGKVVAFSIQFSEPMATGPVNNLANYAVAVPGKLTEVASGGPSYSKSVPLKSVTYDATTNTAYLVPVTKVNPYAFVPANQVKTVARRVPYLFQIEEPEYLAAVTQAMKPSSGTPPALNQSISSLTDTSGNPITTTGGGGLAGEGSFFTLPKLAKASPTVLSQLFGTPTHATPRAKPGHKAK